MGKNLLDKVRAPHSVASSTRTDAAFIGAPPRARVTSPQAFSMIRERRPRRAVPWSGRSTVDHHPDRLAARPLRDGQAENMMSAISATAASSASSFQPRHRSQGIVHVIGPELGLT
jgi:homoaconitase/3-isopropylmalate dehydratase large subunit